MKILLKKEYECSYPDTMSREYEFNVIEPVEQEKLDQRYEDYQRYQD